MILFGQKWLYSDKVIVFGQNGCIRAMGLHWGKVVVFGKKWLYSGIVVLFGKGGCNRAKVFVLGTIWFYSGKVVVFDQKWLYSGKNCCIQDKEVVFG